VVVEFLKQKMKLVDLLFWKFAIVIYNSTDLAVVTVSPCFFRWCYTSLIFSDADVMLYYVVSYY